MIKKRVSAGFSEDTYPENHVKVLLLPNISDVYNPFSFLFIKAIPVRCKTKMTKSEYFSSKNFLNHAINQRGSKHAQH